ncbi:translation elongation factor Ts [Candidatus Peregrinibacteria bacterium HGW-Peregrinibacteria-1]|jgi:elongation factor Ts|nr:MAG: translation elongation factor Ts [Candidatus Peregrinibacteria bacterium HGW-Peregrinibacteria-1]
MTISIELIKKLREATGVSMMACKSSLEEANGDFEEAISLLRKKGEAKAADRAGRETSNGAIVIESDGGKAAIVSLQCETDFVSMGDDFENVARDVAKKLLAGEISAEDRELELLNDAGLRLGENVRIGEMSLLEGATIGSYVHSNKRIGVVIVLDGGNEELAKDIAMHAAATNPVVVSPDEISSELVESEKAIWKEQLANEGKPAEMIDKIMVGKEKKFREENALVKQPFVKNPDQTIEQLLSSAGASVRSFVRMSV